MGSTSQKKIMLKELNTSITCSLCRGYLVDATTLVECLHSFCRACILRYFENFKSACPACNVTHKKKSNPCFRSDPILQTLVYKLVPGLYNREVQRREDFYRSTGVRASSSCSEDSVVGDLKEERDEWIVSTCGEQYQYLSPDDVISLSLEYYQAHMDRKKANEATDNNTTGTNSTNQQDSTTVSTITTATTDGDLKYSANLSAEKTKLLCDNNKTTNKTMMTGVRVVDDDDDENVTRKNDAVKSELRDEEKVNNKVKCEKDEQDDNNNNNNEGGDFKMKKGSGSGDKRYLQCPAAVTMSHLQKFLRMKFALGFEHRVDIIHSGEVLPSHFTLMDVAYTFKWQRTKPMRFFYRIFTPLKIQPIKIISTPSIDGKQLQVVHATTTTTTAAAATTTLSNPPQPKQTSEPVKEPLITNKIVTDAQHNRNKERLMANLQLQSTSKVHEKPSRCPKKPCTVTEKEKCQVEESECIYEYEEPDEEDLRAFAEKRDREWALQKQLDEEKEKYRNNKKRKKSKHSKGNLLYKKRKLHAEITCSESLQKEESLKLKVKLTPHNGYKHKHHKSSQNQTTDMSSQKQPELSSKEKLLQMRQVRHKHISMDDKSKTSSSAATPKSVEGSVDKSLPNPVAVKNNEEPKASASKPETMTITKSLPNNKTSALSPEYSVKFAEPVKKALETIATPSKPPQAPSETPKSVQKETVTSGKTLRSDFAIKTSATKGLCMQKYPTVQIERNEQTERQAQKTFLKTFQSYTTENKFVSPNAHQAEKNAAGASPGGPPAGVGVGVTPKIRPNTYPGKNPPPNGSSNHHRQQFHQQQQASKSLERKIANLHQQCTTIEPKPIVSKLENKSPKIEHKPPHILNSHYSSGFTVSKIETGIKRRQENEHKQDKRPSLEITLINPQPMENQAQTESKPATKRPLPATIPLERIKKSMNRLSGISIISKPSSERCDNSGALDLSKPNRNLMDVTVKPSQLVENQNKILNGLNLLTVRAPSSSSSSSEGNKIMQLSNLQMLSKVALEHPNLNKSNSVSAGMANKRPQMPSLQTLKIPVPHNSGLKSNLAKLPKLNEINKSHFRISNAQLRNMRPNQSQSVRDIPNPSLLVRQQNQNRLNSLTTTSNTNNQGGSSVEGKEQTNGTTTVSSSAVVGNAISTTTTVCVGTKQSNVGNTGAAVNSGNQKNEIKEKNCNADEKSHCNQTGNVVLEKS